MSEPLKGGGLTWKPLADDHLDATITCAHLIAWINDLLAQSKQDPCNIGVILCDGVDSVFGMTNVKIGLYSSLRELADDPDAIADDDDPPRYVISIDMEKLQDFGPSFVWTSDEFRHDVNGPRGFFERYGHPRPE
jgi:hypothetical protein